MPTPAFSINYIVRIYRWEKNKPSSLVGIVEEVGAKGKKAFTNYDELWEILSSQPPTIPFSKERERLERRLLRKPAGRKEVIKFCRPDPRSDF